MKRTVRTRAPAIVATLAAAIALFFAIGPAHAFPTSSYVYPSYNGCVAQTLATASYGGLGEQVGVSTWDYNFCATTVWAKACIMSNSFQLTCTGWDADSAFAYEELSQSDYYYAYGWGSVDSGSDYSTNSVHP